MKSRFVVVTSRDPVARSEIHVTCTSVVRSRVSQLLEILYSGAPDNGAN